MFASRLNNTLLRSKLMALPGITHIIELRRVPWNRTRVTTFLLNVANGRCAMPRSPLPRLVCRHEHRRHIKVGSRRVFTVDDTNDGESVAPVIVCFIIAFSRYCSRCTAVLGER